MISEVFDQIEKHKIPLTSRILCAVSGGIDSVVMLTILNDYRFDCVVAHCNFKLRGKESDDDEAFVKKLADKFEFKFLSEKFDTVSYAEKMGISIQMAARDLRYEWFFKTAEEFKCDYIALAHNSDDQAETIITNLIRGTGIRGLTGMQFVKDKLLRPLIYTSREEIEKFTKDNEIKYRFDSTNATIKYSRNKIRLAIFPLMNEINPSFKKNILKSVNYLKDTEKIMQEYVAQAQKACMSYKNNKIYIDLAILKNFVSVNTVFFELLVSEGIPKNLAVEAINLLDSQSGKHVSFLNIEILRDRDQIIINKEAGNNNIFIHIEHDELSKLKRYGITATIHDYDINIKINKSPYFAYIDFEKLEFPLILRNWEKGDKFMPFGMKGLKKLSDYFSDQKLSVFEKSETLIITSGNKIVWIVGHRIDDRYKITPETKKILILNTSKK
ncbi:MAG: tRNA lysidine(34) synthetase TilS [Bacteroidales bacterium]|jgi:tRNA(Ile)-lysidine synthase|nr:tRNA lysidine(34) synthetase TilS [Bacteroidales bacterium]